MYPLEYISPDDGLVAEMPATPSDAQFQVQKGSTELTIPLLPVVITHTCTLMTGTIPEMLSEGLPSSLASSWFVPPLMTSGCRAVMRYCPSRALREAVAAVTITSAAGFGGDARKSGSGV